MPKRPKDSIAFPLKSGEVVVINKDITYADDHPYVKARPEFFIDVLEDPHMLRGVEQATAGPGERRNR